VKEIEEGISFGLTLKFFKQYFHQNKNIKDKSCVDLVAGKAGVIYSSPFFLYIIPAF
jgi:hypothetical protein